MNLVTITPPAQEPVSLADAKAFMRVEHTDDDSLITSLIVSAREQAEQRTGRALINRIVELSLDTFPPGAIDLRLPTVQSVSSVTYTDAAGAPVIMDAGDYTLDAATPPAGWLLPSDTLGDWPTTYDSVNAVRIRFVTGYGASPDTVPEPIRTWIKVRAGTLYKFREEFLTGMSVSDVPVSAIDSLIDSYRVWRV